MGGYGRARWEAMVGPGGRQWQGQVGGNGRARWDQVVSSHAPRAIHQGNGRARWEAMVGPGGRQW